MLHVEQPTLPSARSRQAHAGAAVKDQFINRRNVSTPQAVIGIQEQSTNVYRALHLIDVST